jgi:hypothetical protein
MTASMPPLQHYLAEWYRSPTTEERLDDALSRLDESVLSACASDAPMRLVMALAVPDDELVFCVFAARSAVAVTRACQRAGIPVQRLSAAVDMRIGHRAPTTH